MNKKVAHKFFAFTLSLLVMFSTLSFSVEKRYCGTDLIDVVVLLTNHNHQDEFCISGDESVAKSGCCKDVIEFVEGNEVIPSTSFDDLEMQQQPFLMTFAVSYLNLFDDLSQALINVEEYSPPNLLLNRIVQHQVFLI